MNDRWTESLTKQLENQDFREAYVREDVRVSVAFQIREMRDQRGWSQEELGRLAGKPQSVIARLEDPDYGRLSLKTLLEIATAFDVALLVRFVSVIELASHNAKAPPTQRPAG